MSYRVDDAGGDSAVMMRLRLAHDVPMSAPGRLEAALVLQAGQFWINHSPYLGAPTPNRETLAAGGGELKYTWTDRLSFLLDYVHRLGSAPASTTTRHDDQLWASLRLSL